MAKGDVIFAFGGAFLVGVLVASIGNLWWMLIAAAAIFLYAARRWKISVSIFLIIFVFLGFSYFLIFINFNEPTINPGEKILAKVLEEPSVYDKYTSIIVGVDGKELKVITSPLNIFRYGDVLEITAQKIEDGTLVFPEIIFLRNESDSLRGRLIEFRHFVIGKYNKHLSHESASLLSGIMLGYKSNFSKDFRDNLSKSGTAHIVALSGYNIAILILAVSYFLLPVVGRKATFVIVTAVILLFTVMVGGEASIVRAAIMGFLVILARESGRLYSLRNSIVLAAFLMILFNPRILAFDLGFQLSFLSLLGLIYIAPILKSAMMTFKNISDGIKENTSNTLAAQLAVSPLILNTFGQVSFLGVVANVLILSFIPLTMLLGLVLFLASIISSGLAEIISWFLEFILQYMIGVINLFGRLDFGIESSFGILYSIIYYIVLIGFIYNFKKHERA